MLWSPLLAQQQDTEPPDYRILGVLPNYRTADGTKDFEPLTAGGKFKIAGKDSFDWPVYLLAGAFAGMRQLSDDTPSFGQGVKGYSKRYGAALADQVMGNLMTEAIMPSLFREDPRYFRKVHGSVWRRTGLHAHADSGDPHRLGQVALQHFRSSGQRNHRIDWQCVLPGQSQLFRHHAALRQPARDRCGLERAERILAGHQAPLVPPMNVARTQTQTL
jgi:hypothetical protein